MAKLIKKAVNDTWQKRNTWGTFFKGLPMLLKRKPAYSGGQFGGGGATSYPIQPIPEFELVKDTLWIPITQSYNDAFSEARKKGLKTFMFNGELKTTELGTDPKAQEAGSKRFQTTGLIPVEYTKQREKIDK